MAPNSKGVKTFPSLYGEVYIPTAKAKTFTVNSINDGLEYLRKCDFPIVLKADGLAAGKGVIIAGDLETAEKSLRSMLVEEQFGEASRKGFGRGVPGRDRIICFLSLRMEKIS